MRPRSTTLTPQELEIMKIVWQKGQATVRDVYEALLERRKIAYTTVMTMMRVMERKGHLKTRRENRAYVYRPSHPERQVLRSMVREFVDRVFNGSARPLLVHLVEDRRLTREEFEELVRMAREAKE
jgi:BlaI family transcriptional regulator, penicillinase repressor